MLGSLRFSTTHNNPHPHDRSLALTVTARRLHSTELISFLSQQTPWIIFHLAAARSLTLTITASLSLSLLADSTELISFLSQQVEYPNNVHLIRGNHEAADINALFGFRIECIERMGERDGIWAWHRINRLFNWLPLAALIEKKIICMHGGIGRSINHVEQIENIQRPITMEAGSIVLMDLLWSDPTENDSVEGLRPNARGPGLVTFGAFKNEDTTSGTRKQAGRSFSLISTWKVGELQYGSYKVGSGFALVHLSDKLEV
ncbi:hypothetical protein Ancab_023056 [Ancistrocladus abbreviatus]